MAADTSSRWRMPVRGAPWDRRPQRRPCCGGRHEPTLLLLVPLLAEWALLAGAPPEVTVVHTGMGRRRSLAAAEAALRLPGRAVAVAGFCGGLAGDLRPGDVVVATSVVPAGRCGTDPAAQDLGDPRDDGLAGPAAALQAALRARGVARVRAGRIVSSPRLVHGPERARLAAQGALAVDMESAWLRTAAGDRPFAVLRVVLDTPSARLLHPHAAAGGLVAAVAALRRATPALADWARVAAAPTPPA